MKRPTAIMLLALLCLAPFGPARAERIVVAVAANFTDTAQQIAAAFEQASGHRADLVPGSTGKHFAQIVNGAPFDVLLAADRARPETLERQGRVRPGSRFTYALGRLALWRPHAERVAPGDLVETSTFRHLALANPRLAPYGLAARQTLESLGQWDRLQDRLVFGENVGQAFRFVDSGAAELGFVALAQLRRINTNPGAWWLVPETHHAPIEQQAVLLSDAPPAAAFLAFLREERARGMIRAAGYGVPDVH
ncbi:MAG: molybdate ABC transporter substrate-binding protein [Xanthomonadales bacterium]